MLTFFTSPLGKVAIVIVAVLVAFLAFKAWLSAHDANIREAALNEFNAAQLAQSLKDKAEFDRRMAEVNKAHEEEVQKLISGLATIDTDFDKAEKDIMIVEENDPKSSKTLQETIRQLRQRQ